MKTHYFKSISFILFLVFSLSGLYGHDSSFLPGSTSEQHPNQYFVKLCHGVSHQEAKALMAELNSVELWKNDKIGLRLWAVKKFPYSCTDGEITDINGHLVRSKKKTSIDDAVVNMVFELESTDFESAHVYFEDLDLRGELGTKPIRISILDSGISNQGIAGNSSFTGPISYTGYDYVDNDPVPNDQNGHGTQIAGIIYGLVSQLGTPSNISFDIRKTHDAYGLGNISNLISATVDAVDAGADIINMSFSYYEMLNEEELNPLRLAIDYAEQNGVLVIASAGNQFGDNDNAEKVPVPATFPNENIISVASNGPDESISLFSNYGNSSVDVSILGEHIPGPGLNGEQFYASGTSFSTAIVSGLSAIIGSRQDQFNGCEIKCILISTSKKLPGWVGLNRASGIINFKKALDEPPAECGATCATLPPVPEIDCGTNCPPETNDMDICVEKEVTVVDKLLVYDVEQDPIAFTAEPVYGPFDGSVTIYPDGSFVYTSFGGKPDLFVYQVCDNNQSECSDGCNQGVVYINNANCNPPSENGSYLNDEEDCVEATGDDPKLLTFQYTGHTCRASEHLQDLNKVSCSGNTGFASQVYVTAIGDSDKYYLVNEPVKLNTNFSIDAAVLGEDKLKSTTTIYLMDNLGEILQTMELHTSGSQPLRVGDQFAGISLKGYLSKNNVACGNVDQESRNIFDCKEDTGGNPRLLTFRYTGEDCTETDHDQDASKVECTGNPMSTPVVYVTAIGDGDKYYAINRRVALDETFSIDAASVGEKKLKSETTLYLKDIQGTVLQTVKIHTSGSQPLGSNDQFGSLLLTGYLSEHAVSCGLPEIPENPGDCCETTGDDPQILTLQYTGGSCLATSHNQEPSQVRCSGDPERAPFVYVTAQSKSKKREIFFKDLQVPLQGVFDIDAASIGKKKFESAVIIYLKDAEGRVLQEIEFHTSCSEPLVIGNQFGALQLKGYLAENGALWGTPPVSEICNPTFECIVNGKRSAIGLIYVGSTTTTVNAYGNSDSRDHMGSYQQVGPGDFIVFSSLYRNKSNFGHFFLQWSGGLEVEIPIETSVDILGNIYGDFKVVQQLDQDGNDCRIPYSSCYEVNRNCNDPALNARQEEIPGLFAPITLDGATNLQPFPGKDVSIYPNPARDFLYLNLGDYSGQAVEIELYDSVGRRVKRQEVVEAVSLPLEINVGNLPNGFYSVVIYPEGSQPVLKKLIVTGK